MAKKTEKTPEVMIKIKVITLRAKIKAVQKSVEALDQYGLREQFLHRLIASAANKHYKKADRWDRTRISVRDVKAILKGLVNLDEYIFEEPK